jgi:hypothetical protein
MMVFSPEHLSVQSDNVYRWENHASSVYDGLSLSLNRRLTNEIEFSGNYTFSKAIDDASDFEEQPNNPYLLPAERAVSGNDQRHRFVFSGTFDLPFGDEDEGKSSGAITKVFGNIEVAPILTQRASNEPSPVLTQTEAALCHCLLVPAVSGGTRFALEPRRNWTCASSNSSKSESMASWT